MLKATKHQGHISFNGNGRQCVANAASAILMCKTKQPSEWDTATLDTILENGDQLYVEIQHDSNAGKYLTVEELPKDSLHIAECLTGTLNGETSLPFYSLKDSIDTLMSADDSYCIFTAGNSEPCYSSAIIRHNNKYYFFDPHCRSDTGMQSPDGAAILTIHENQSAVVLFIQHLASSLNQKGAVPFELASIQIPQKLKLDFEGSVSDSESAFSGFDPVSEDEVSCRLFLANEAIEDLVVSDVSDCSSMDSEEFPFISANSISNSEIDNAMHSLNDSAVFLSTINTGVFDEFSEEKTSVDGINHEELEHIYSDDTESYVISDYSSDQENLNADIESLDDEEFVLPSTSESDSESLLPLSIIRKKHKRRTMLKKKRQILKEKVDIQTETNQEIENRTSCRKTTVSDVNEQMRGSRKRKRQEQNWKYNIRKRERNHGRTFTNKHGNVKKARVLKPACGDGCKFKCNSKFNDREREKIFHTFWGYGDIQKQRQFVVKHVTKKMKKRNKKVPSRRQASYIWVLPHASSNHTSARVCKSFFLNTLSISDQFVYTAFSKDTLGIPTHDKRGKSERSRHNKTNAQGTNSVRQHIDSFHARGSHYCRKDSGKIYLSPELNVQSMYRLYKKDCSNKKIKSVSEKVYRRIFNFEYNISFKAPKKDQCDLCSSYVNSSPDDRLLLKHEYENHIQNKNLAFENKNSDKLKCKNDTKLSVACFDLEQVLLTPKSFESCLYYKRQLNNYNFTIYDLATTDGFAYLWNETVAGRGGCEIASCVFDYIKSKAAEGKTKFIFYSDNCIPQNKNRFYITMLWYALNKFNLEFIQHKYLEKGHTMSENDSMHAAVESASKHLCIYTTPQWATVIQGARKGKPYLVKEMSLHDFFDFRALSARVGNFEITDQNEKIVWTLLRVIKVQAETPQAFSCQYNYGGRTHYVEFFPRNFRRGMPEIPELSQYELEVLRTELIPLSELKFRDLISVCINDVVPKVHHVFYALLPHEAGQ